jgi:hypothetical protein
VETEQYLGVSIIDEHVDYFRQDRDSESNTAFRGGRWVRREQEGWRWRLGGKTTTLLCAPDKSNHRLNYLRL